MLTPLEISFHGIEKSEAVEAKIREKFARIEKRFDRMTHARVVVEAPKGRAPRAKIFHVKIEIGVPSHSPIVVKHEPSDAEGHTDVQLALRDAFEAATRQVDDLAAKMNKPAQREQTRRRPQKESPAD